MPQGHSMQEIALEAGVSIATVSRVLSGRDNVRPETAQRVMALVDKYHFRPNANARGLYNRQSNVLAMVLPELINPYYGQLFTAAEKEAQGHGCSLELLHHPYSQSITRQMAERMIERRLDGVVMNGEFVDQRTGGGDLKLMEDIRHYMKLVLVGNMRPVPGFMNIVIDLAACARQVVDYLYALGHRRIVMLCGRRDVENPFSRTVGFLGAMRAHGLDAENAHIPESDDPEGGMRAMATALEGPNRPTAVLCANDMTALGAIRLAMGRGLQIPRDLSVVGCDNSFLCEYQPVALTSIDIKTDDMARFAVQMLLGPDALPDRVLTGELVRRQSCAPI